METVRQIGVLQEATPPLDRILADGWSRRSGRYQFPALAVSIQFQRGIVVVTRAIVAVDRIGIHGIRITAASLLMHTFPAPLGLGQAGRRRFSIRRTHHVHVRIWSSCPHDVRARNPVRGRKTSLFRIEGPHDHPVRPDGDQRACLVVWVRVASLRRSSKHVGDTWNQVRRFRFMLAEIHHPLHRGRVGAHGRQSCTLLRHAGLGVGAGAKLNGLHAGGHFYHSRVLSDL